MTEKEKVLQTNYRLEEDEISCQIHHPTETIYIASPRTAKITLDDISGFIIFDGYWYTEKWREEYQRNTEETKYPWVEEINPPVKVQIHYTKYSKDFCGTFTTTQTSFAPPRETNPFSHLLSKSQDPPKQITMYKYPLVEEIFAEIEIYERQIFEDTSGGGVYDEEVGGNIILFPTDLNCIKFRVLERLERLI